MCNWFSLYVQVFQRRLDGSVDFLRNWKDDQRGFGWLQWEFWMGKQFAVCFAVACRLCCHELNFVSRKIRLSYPKNSQPAVRSLSTRSPSIVGGIAAKSFHSNVGHCRGFFNMHKPLADCFLTVSFSFLLLLFYLFFLVVLVFLFFFIHRTIFPGDSGWG